MDSDQRTNVIVLTLYTACDCCTNSNAHRCAERPKGEKKLLLVREGRAPDPKLKQ